MFWFKGRTKCHKVQGMLSEYIDGVLSPERERVVEQHLEACESCRSELESLQMTVQLLHQVPQVPAPRSFALAGVERKRVSISAPPSPRWLRPATVLATFVLMALLLGDFLHVFEREVGQVLVSSATPEPGIMASTGTPAPTATPEPGIVALPGMPTLTPTPESATLRAGEEDMAKIGEDSLPEAAPVPMPTVTPRSISMVAPIPSVGAEVAPAAEAMLAETPMVEPKTDEGIMSLPEEGPVSGGVSWPLRQIEIGLGVVVAMLLGMMVYSYRQRGRRRV